MQDSLLTTAQVADQFKVNERTVGRWVREGRLKGVRTPGGTIRVRQSEVDRFLQDPDAAPSEAAS